MSKHSLEISAAWQSISRNLCGTDYRLRKMLCSDHGAEIIDENISLIKLMLFVVHSPSALYATARASEDTKALH